MPPDGLSVRIGDAGIIVVLVVTINADGLEVYVRGWRIAAAYARTAAVPTPFG